MSFKHYLNNIFNESITVSVEGPEPQLKLNNLLDLSHMLFHKIYDKWFDKWTQEQKAFWRNNYGSLESISPDGNDHFNNSGIINIYLYPVPPELINKLKQAIHYWLTELNIEFEQFKDDISNMNGKPIIRVPILKLPQSKTELPELNMSNQNAYEILHNLLGFPNLDGVYRINAHDLIIKINQLNKFNIQSNERKPSDNQEPGQARLIDYGLSQNQIKSKLKILEQIANWAIKNGYTTIVGY